MPLIHENLSLIPIPKDFERMEGEFIIDASTVIQSDPNIESLGLYLKSLLKQSSGMDLLVHLDQRSVQKDDCITFLIDPKLKYLGPEGYLLQVDPNHAAISASAPRGLFYGIQTFRQLLPWEIEAHDLNSSIQWKVPCILIRDLPRFSWRGFMLDEGRHFFGKQAVKTLLDVMALLKMNVFHWHLTEDQGWRIEIKQYPKLIEVGSKRKETQINGVKSEETDGIPHEGYYTQEEIQEVVEYAKERFIQVVPEIEMPGHCVAALASYPELSCREESLEVPATFGIKKDVYCAGKERVFEFLTDVLSEVMELFPSNVIHIGGDEVPKDRWKECEDCQNRIQEEGLKDEKELQAYFINRIGTFLHSKGRRMMGWNEIMNGRIRKDAIGQYWRWDWFRLRKYLKRGQSYVMSRSNRLYLNHDLSLSKLKKCYSYDPVPKLLKKEKDHILGVEAPAWTEWIKTEKDLQEVVFPRLLAVAEMGWSSRKDRDFESFRKRLEQFLKRFDALDLAYSTF